MTAGDYRITVKSVRAYVQAYLCVCKRTQMEGKKMTCEEQLNIKCQSQDQLSAFI